MPIYEPLRFFALRAPALPFETYLEISQQQGWCAEKLSNVLREHPQIQRALILGNLSLYTAFQQCVEKPDNDCDKVVAKVLRLLVRMSTRPTPLAIYAGVALGEWAERSDVSLADFPPRTRTKPDSEFVAKLALGLEGQCLKSLRIFTNPATHICGNRVYLIEKAAMIDELHVDGLSIDVTTEVQHCLQRARQPVSYADLHAELVSKCHLSEEDADSVLEQLVEHTFLLTSLRSAAMAGGDHLLAELDKLPACKAVHDMLRHLVQDSARYDESASNLSLTELRALATKGQAFVDTSTGVAVQTDMALPVSSCSLIRNVAVESTKLIDLLVQLGCLQSGPPHIAAYRKRFLEKYETREVKLLELLNQEVGLGLPVLEEPEPSVRLGEKQRLLGKLIHDAIRERRVEAIIDEEFVRRLSATADSKRYLPLSLDFFVGVLAASAEDIDSGRYLLCAGRTTVGAGRSLGRFADFVSEQATTLLSAVNAQEVAALPDTIVAELFALPRTLRVANVSSSASARQFTMTMDAAATQPSSIELDDLWVGVDNGRFYLRSAALGKRVVVATTHLMNSKFNTAIARFLRDVSLDAVSAITPFQWDANADGAFLPRVRYEKFILSPARWNLDPADMAKSVLQSPAEFGTWLASWREQWLVPRYVFLTELDNRLLLDLENDWQQQELRKELLARSGSGMLRLEESLASADSLWFQGPQGHYVSELVVSLIMSKDAMTDRNPLLQSAINVASDPRRNAGVQRLFLPGSEWLYAKIYCGSNSADELIAGALRQFAERARQDQLSDGWFFLRYADPEPHVRVRLHAKSNEAAIDLYRRICKLIDSLGDSTISRICIDTYDRETERYGGPDAIVVAEQLFCADSDAIVQLLDSYSELDRVNLGTATIDRFLQSLALRGEERRQWYQHYADKKNESGAEYRARKNDLLALFLPDNDAARELDALLAPWRESLRRIGARYDQLDADRLLIRAKPDIYRSLVHMHCNRLGLNLLQEAQALALAARAFDAIQHLAAAPKYG